MGIIVAGFPGIGKSYLTKVTDLKISDSDSSKFSWLAPGIRNPEFPRNYIEHISLQRHLNNLVLVSSHSVVRQALVDAHLPFILIYPHHSLKDEYLTRFAKRGSDQAFIELLRNQWDNWISECRIQQHCRHIVLSPGKYLSDMIEFLK